jgi:tight adherence protein C
MTYALLAVAAIVCIGTGVVGLASSPVRRIRQRLNALHTEAADRSRPFAQRVAVPVAQWITRWLVRVLPGEYRRRLAQRLEQAGMAATPGVDRYLLTRAVMWAGLAGLSAGMVALGVPVATVIRYGGIMGLALWILGRFQLGRAATARQKAIARALPDLMDLLVVSLEAGLGFESALDRVVQRRSDPLSDELRRALAETHFGKTRAEALTDTARRLGVDDVSRFAQAVAQADMLGLGLAPALRTQAELLRRIRMVRAEEAAAKIPVKMLMPMAMFTLPGIFLMVLGPAIIQAVRIIGSRPGGLGL